MCGLGTRADDPAAPCRAAVPCSPLALVPEVAALFTRALAPGGGDSAACASSGPCWLPAGSGPETPRVPPLRFLESRSHPEQNPDLPESGPWGYKPLSPEELCSKILRKKNIF